MAARSDPSASALPVAIDLVLIARLGRELGVFLARSESRRGWHLPTARVGRTTTLDAAASELALRVLGRPAGFLAQHRAVTTAEGSRGRTLSVSYIGLTTTDRTAGAGGTWMPLSRLPSVHAKERDAIQSAVHELRRRLNQEPVAFALLPERFTLSELQLVYEILLGHRLHKASFRRALLAADLAQATDEWRSESRGRPAQLFRFAPKAKRRARRALRFDLLEP